MKTILPFILAITLSLSGLSQQVRITQIYGGGGQPGSMWNQDFIEIFNSGYSSIDISGWSVQYASATGSTWSAVSVPASTILPGGTHYLFGLATGADGNPLPTPDATSSFDMDEAEGKVVLVNNSTVLSGSSCSDPSIIDIVGYGVTASCYETAPVITTGQGGIDHTKSYVQTYGGCLNHNDNSMDFTVQNAGQPKNYAFGNTPCSQGPQLSIMSAGINFMATVQPGSYDQEVYILFGYNLDNYPGNITITAPAGMEVSLTSGSGFANSIDLPFTSSTLDQTQIYVRTPISVTGLVSGIITNVGGGSGINIPISGVVIDTEPTSQTNNIVLSNITDNTMDISWTNGNGSSRIVVVRETAVTGGNFPSDGRQYNANTDINLAPEVNTGNLGNRVVYSGSGSGPITVSGLLPGTNYSVTAFEFNGSNGTNNYYTYTFNEVNAGTTGSPAVLLQREFNNTGSPLYMASGSNNRMPTMFRGSFSNLLPNTTYRYYTQAAVAADLRTYSTGAGDPILIDYTVSPVTYTYSSSPSITTAGGYGKFITNGSGYFSGYFGFVHNADARFTPGDTIFPAIAIATDGTAAVEHRYAFTDGTKVLQFANTSGPNDGTFIKGASYAPQTSVLFLFDRADGAVGRPLSGSLVEGPAAVSNSGTAVWGNNFIPGYDNTAGSWNSIIPNVNNNGVQFIQAIDPNQPWPYTGACKRNSSAIWAGISTINPTGGSTTAVQISAAAAPLGPPGSAEQCIIIIPIRLSSFDIQKFGSKVKLNWTTEQELNSKEFIIERSANSTTWAAIATVPAAGNSNTKINYTAIDNNPVKGINFYRIRKIDLDNKFDYSATKSVLFNSSYEILVTPNPARDIVNIYVDNNSKPVTILLVDASGKVVRKLNSNESYIQINTSALARGVYYVKVMNETTVSVSKVLLQ